MTTVGAGGPLRAQNFRWFFAGQGVNLAGSTMNSVALAFAVLEVSHRPSALGSVLAAYSIPMVVFILAGGVITDRLGQAFTIQISNAGAGITQLVIAALVIGGQARIGQLIVLSAVNGMFAAVNRPALASLVPQLVARDQLQAANALISLQRTSLRVIGPGLAGLIVATAGAGWAIGFDGATYLVSVVLLAKVRIASYARDGERPSVLSDLREGWAYVRSTTWLWVSIAAFTVINALATGALLTLGPMLAMRTPIGESGWGLIVSAESLGLLVTSLVLLRVRLERPLFWGMLAMSVAALPLIVLGLEPALVPALVASFIAGAGMEVFSMAWALSMQEHVPEQMLPRAYSYDALGSFVAIPVGQLAAGPIGAAFGVQPAMLVSGLLFVLLCLAPLLSRSVRDLQRVSAAPVPSEEAASDPQPVRPGQ